MSNVSITATLAMTLAAMTPADRERAEYVILANSIAAVESGMNYEAIGDGGKAVGAWQMHVAAWITANQWRKAQGLETIRRTDWKNKENQRAMAVAYLCWCKEQLRKAGIKEPTIEQVYIAYGWGFGNYKDSGFNMDLAPAHKRDAAERVANIYKELTK